jgi:ATP-dependent DNA helicase DinG
MLRAPLQGTDSAEWVEEAEGAAGLEAEVRRAFSPTGPLAGADPGYKVRDVQTSMAQAVTRAIEARSALVVEAGTGVGKTFAYLVPVLLAGRRTLLSTATKSLQDQLFYRDLPRLREALKLPVTVALLKGRASYLCLHRLQQARESAMLPDRWAVRTLARVEAWAQATTSGDIGELEGLDERSDVIPLVTSTRENCLGSECPEFQACHVMRARRDAMAADVVVVNHHLFFADLALRDSGVAELLPTVDVAVFDEAHQIVEAGVQFLGRALGTGQVIDFARDLLAAGLAHARGLAAWNELAAACETTARDLRLACAGPLREVRVAAKRRWDEAARDPALSVALEGLAMACRQAADALDAVADAAPDLARLQDRAQELAAGAEVFQHEAAAARVRWIDLTPHQARLIESPLDISEMLTEQRRLSSRAWIFTSATLGDDAELRWFSDAAGLADAVKLRLGSPFDYAHHARLYVPPRFPAPADEAHPQMVGRSAAHCAAALGGRTFVLTTTLRALRLVAQALQAELAVLDCPLEVLVQGTAAKRALMSRFLQGDSVLIGSHSFWEGIDVPGDALQCVIIDKLPFPPPSDPLVEARVKQLKAQGRDAFNDYFVAETAVSLKQGAGRLIRTESDQGLLVVCDTRLRQMRYGQRLVEALPAMTVLNSGEEALAWLRGLQALRRDQAS